jgi:hypothetical protein
VRATVSRDERRSSLVAMKKYNNRPTFKRDIGLQLENNYQSVTIWNYEFYGEAVYLSSDLDIRRVFSGSQRRNERDARFFEQFLLQDRQILIYWAEILRRLSSSLSPDFVSGRLAAIFYNCCHRKAT